MARLRVLLGGRRPSSTRYRTVVASLIALTALVGALSAWRAEAVAMRGENAERKGFADGVANEQEKAPTAARGCG